MGFVFGVVVGGAAVYFFKAKIDALVAKVFAKKE